VDSSFDKNALFSTLNDFYLGLLPDSLSWAAYLGTGLTIVLILVNSVLMLTAFGTYMERRVLGRFQTRLGPNRVGPFGLLQPLADLLKLIMKEDLRPLMADRLTFFLAPVLMVTSMLVVVAVVPFGSDSFLADLNIGVLYLVGIPTIATVSMFLGGWGSGNRFALLGAARAVAMLISYEVPMIISLAGILILAGSMSLVDVVEAQRLPFILLQPMAFFVFLIAASAEMNRSPFDLMEAESELTAGFHTEFSGMRFGLLQLAEFGEVVVTSAILATLFLRGWENPFIPADWSQVLPPQVWLIGKILFFMLIFTWIRATLPRMRIDQVMAFAWKVLFPLAVINMFVTAALVVAWPEPTYTQLWAIAGINWVVAIGCLIGFSLALDKHRKNPTASVQLVKIPTEAA
jgi:NADH-quinone oxidoreductase subunit H